MTNQISTNKQLIALCNLTHRLLGEEVKTLNSASRTALGIQLIYAKEKCFFVRYYSQDKRKTIRLSEWITGKKLSDIDFAENSLDQLKVRIILRKFLMKLLLKAALLRISGLLAVIKNNPMGFFRFIRAR
jgi:hypothetical protein